MEGFSMAKTVEKVKDPEKELVMTVDKLRRTAMGRMKSFDGAVVALGLCLISAFEALKDDGVGDPMAELHKTIDFLYDTFVPKPEISPDAPESPTSYETAQ
jgi:hypothetical protein